MVVLVVVHLFLQVYVSLLDSVDTENVDKTAAVFSVDNTKITLKILSLVQYYDEDGVTDIFNEKTLETIDYSESKLNIKYKNTEYNTRAEIQCTITNLESEIEIKDCSVFIQSKLTEAPKIFSIKSTVKLNKNTKYIFENHVLRFKIGATERIIFHIKSVLIQFYGYTQKYTWKIFLTMERRLNLQTTYVLNNFENYGGEIVSENDPEVPEISEEPVAEEPAEEDPAAKEPAAKEPAHEDPEKTEQENDKDLEPNHEDLEEDSSKKGLWITVILVITGLLILAVIVGVLIYFNRHRLLKNISIA
ncbi:hypothetical protein RF11_09864 [Thelohanellus kitauei]|uniref:Uncharacterized protein n=1 Tax=Thelohanellus kitauei TaxID=669202 RepID=A0A0C2MY04_THEKT|nr:hypothetical protein RF11_09864 [Thelohanellus kitauei]